MSSTHRGWRNRGRLPHADFSGLTQAVTFRCADALPAEVLERLRFETQSSDPAATDERRNALLRERINVWLDAGHGACVLGQGSIGDIVAEELLRHDGIRYRLDAFVVMPNHVHVLLGDGEESLGLIVKSWKGASSRRINMTLGSQGSLWQREYYDRFIRDEDHHRLALQYIVKNPVEAGLVADSWMWRGLWVREELRGGLKPAVRAD